jgi:hypothetical protein
MKRRPVRDFSIQGLFGISSPATQRIFSDFFCFMRTILKINCYLRRVFEIFALRDEAKKQDILKNRK